MIAYFAADLLWASKIKATSEAIGVEARPVRNAEMLGARLGDSDVRGLIVDLDHSETAMSLVALARADSKTGNRPACRRITVAAFGAHVDTDALHQAREAGCDLVLTRGAMARSLEDVLRRLEGPGEALQW